MVLPRDCGKNAPTDYTVMARADTKKFEENEIVVLFTNHVVNVVTLCKL